jgi:hypothetical protein
LLAKPYFISVELTAKTISEPFGFGSVLLFESINVQVFGTEILNQLPVKTDKLEESVVVSEEKQELRANKEIPNNIYFFIF